MEPDRPSLEPPEHELVAMLEARELELEEQRKKLGKKVTIAVVVFIAAVVGAIALMPDEKPVATKPKAAPAAGDGATVGLAHDVFDFVRSGKTPDQKPKP